MSAVDNRDEFPTDRWSAAMERAIAEAGAGGIGASGWVDGGVRVERWHRACPRLECEGRPTASTGVGAIGTSWDGSGRRRGIRRAGERRS